MKKTIDLDIPHNPVERLARNQAQSKEDAIAYQRRIISDAEKEIRRLEYIKIAGPELTDEPVNEYVRDDGQFGVGA